MKITMRRANVEQNTEAMISVTCTQRATSECGTNENKKMATSHLQNQEHRVLRVHKNIMPVVMLGAGVFQLFPTPVVIRIRRFLFTYMHGNFGGESGWGKVVEIMLLNKDWDQNLPATRLLSLLSSSELSQVARGCKVSNWTATLIDVHTLGHFQMIGE